jgi:hypothetical protein
MKGRDHAPPGAAKPRRYVDRLDTAAALPEKRIHDYVRNGITSLFAAVDMATTR